MKTLKIYETPALDLCRVVSHEGFATSVGGTNEGFIWDDEDIIKL